MAKKRITFYGDVWNKYPLWKQAIVLIPAYAVFISIPFLKEVSFLSRSVVISLEVIYVTIVLATLIYLILSYRKNQFNYRKGTLFSMKINGKKMDMDASFIDSVDWNRSQLEITRINRLDTFNVSNIRKEDVDKLIRYINEKRNI